MSKLQGKVAIVTGAGRGVGAVTAEMLAADGALVIVNDLDAEEANNTTDRITGAGGQALAMPGSVTDRDFPDQLIDFTVDACGGIDIIVNNAGYVWNSAMHKHTDEQWEAMLDVHLTAPFRILRSFSKWLRPSTKKEMAENGVISCRKVVNISSVAGTTGAATQLAYSAGKAGILGLTRTLAKEWGRYNVTVNAVAFGIIETRLTQSYPGSPPTVEVDGREHRVGLSEEQIDSMLKVTSLERTGQPKDAAGAVYLFCIPESDFVTGQVLTCSGGLPG